MKGITYDNEEDFKNWLNNFFHTDRAIFGGTVGQFGRGVEEGHKQQQRIRN